MSEQPPGSWQQPSPSLRPPVQVYAPPPSGYPAYPPPPPPRGVEAGMRVDLVQGTPFGVAYPLVKSVPSGAAVGSMVAGIASILVALIVSCFGLVGSGPGWGPAVAGAFAVLTVFLGLGAIGLGVVSLRQIRRAGRIISGKGMAVTGIVCGGIGAGLALLALVVSFALTQAN